VSLVGSERRRHFFPASKPPAPSGRAGENDRAERGRAAATRGRGRRPTGPLRTSPDAAVPGMDVTVLYSSIGGYAPASPVEERAASAFLARRAQAEQHPGGS